MKTVLLDTSSESIEKAAKLLKNQELVAIPTETVYGLAADAFNKEAIQKIFNVKGRPQNNPLIVHIASNDQLTNICQEFIKDMQTVTNKFWPGPLTIITQKHQDIPSIVTANLDSVAVRFPAHTVAQEIIKKSGPLVAPSANTSTKPSPTTAQHVLEDLKDKIAAVIDAGACEFGVESTVIDMRQKPYTILRPGMITLEDLQAEIGKDNVTLHNKTSQKNTTKNQTTPEKQIAHSPGMLYKHYSPHAKVIMIKSIQAMQEQMQTQNINPSNTVLICNQNTKQQYIQLSNNPLPNSLTIWTYKDATDLAKHLFHFFRLADKEDKTTIFVETVNSAGVGAAVMNRLSKAAEN